VDRNIKKKAKVEVEDRHQKTMLRFRPRMRLYVGG
jgi:hypothetical protein